MKKIIIAIDGFSSCGKSTMAKALARNIGYLYFDSGAMYRAVALYCMQNGLINNKIIDTETLRSKMKDIHITFEADPETKNSLTFLNGVNVEHEIRTLEVSQVVSQVLTERSQRNTSSTGPVISQISLSVRELTS